MAISRMWLLYHPQKLYNILYSVYVYFEINLLTYLLIIKTVYIDIIYLYITSLERYIPLQGVDITIHDGVSNIVSKYNKVYDFPSFPLKKITINKTSIIFILHFSQ